MKQKMREEKIECTAALHNCLNKFPNLFPFFIFLPCKQPHQHQQTTLNNLQLAVETNELNDGELHGWIGKLEMNVWEGRVLYSPYLTPVTKCPNAQLNARTSIK